MPLAIQRKSISVSSGHTVAVKRDGTCLSVGANDYGQIDVSAWTNIVAVSCGMAYTVGLKADGTCVATGQNNYSQCNVSGWTDIVAIAATFRHTVGLKADGTCVATGRNNESQCDVGSWTNIIAIAAGGYHTIGLKADGTCVVVGENWQGQCDVSGWTDIVAIAAGENYSLGVKADGTCVAVGLNSNGQCNVGSWTNIVALAAGTDHTVGLRADGTCVATGSSYYLQCGAAGWTNVVEISANAYISAAVRNNGTALAIGINYNGQCNVDSWTNIYVPAQTISATVNCDSLRRPVVVIGANLDSLRRTSTNVAKLADSLRSLHRLVAPINDATRILLATHSASTDTLRSITHDFVDVVGVDTARLIASQVALATDSRRGIAAQFAPHFDTVRQTTIAAGVLADIERKTSKLISGGADTARAIITGQALTANIDVLRLVAASASVSADILRKLQGALANIASLSLIINAKSLSDTFAVECFDPAVAVGCRIGGGVKNFGYSFVAGELSITGGRRSVIGAYDIDDLLNKEIAYSITTPITAQKIMQALATALGKTAFVAIDDFWPADLAFAVVGGQASAANQGTAREIIGRLFGWTDRVPHRMVNVYLRGGNLHVFQRGKETGAVAIQRCGVPTVLQKRIRTLLSSTNTDGQKVAGMLAGGSDYASPTYYTGTKTFGDATVTYINGLVVSEAQGGRITTYTYSSSSPPARLVSKQTVSATEKVVTNYIYTGDDLVREEESIYSVKDGFETLDTTKITRYVPLGQGHWGVSVDVDGKIASTNIIRGNPGGVASPFAIEAYSANAASYTPKSRNLRGRYVGDAYIPVLDDATLDAVAAAVEWLDGRIEERVTVDVYDDYVFDLDKRIVFAGTEYYLERNVITQTPRRFVQRLELVRWY